MENFLGKDSQLLLDIQASKADFHVWSVMNVAAIKVSGTLVMSSFGEIW